MIPLRDVIPSRTFPFFTIAFIVLNSIAFLFEQTLSAPALEQFVRSLRSGPCAARRAQRVHVDVPARRLAALSRKHALPVDLRRQRRGSSWPCALRRLLSAVRRCRSGRACVHESHLEDSDDRRERRHCRCDGRLFRPVSELARAGARAALHHLGNHRSAGHSLPRHSGFSCSFSTELDRWRSERARKQEESRSGRTSRDFWREWQASSCCASRPAPAGAARLCKVLPGHSGSGTRTR